jgi:hypothetical protein
LKNTQDKHVILEYDKDGQSEKNTEDKPMNLHIYEIIIFPQRKKISMNAQHVS